MSGFQMSGALRFDLAKGHVVLSGEVDPKGAATRLASRAVVSMDALLVLCRELPPEQVTAFGHRLGHDIGRRMVERLATEPAVASSELIVDHLGGELALMGFGDLSLELWGRALVFNISESPLISSSEAGPSGALLAALVEGAMARSMSRDVHVLPIFRYHGQVRLLVCGSAAKDRVSGWLSEGCHYGEALARLNETAGAA